MRGRILNAYGGQLACLCMLFVFFFSAGYAITVPTQQGEYTSDARLKQSAIESGLIPHDADEDYFQQEIVCEHSVTTWILLPRSYKVEMIDQLKGKFLSQMGVTIAKPSDYYVDEINDTLYDSISKDEYFRTAKKGIGVLFKIIAVYEGDWDDGSGRSKVDILKEYVGEEMFQWYKLQLPDKYQHLLEMDER